MAMTQLTKNFSLREMTASATASRMGIGNVPTEKEIRNLRMLCEKILQPLRDAWGQPIVVSSGYRCKALNRKVGGVWNSDHLYGCAADIKTVGDRPEENKRLFKLAVKMMIGRKLKDVKQIIDEHQYDWIHISVQDGRSEKREEVVHI